MKPNIAELPKHPLPHVPPPQQPQPARVQPPTVFVYEKQEWDYIRGARLPTWAMRVGHAGTAREGRRLPVHRAARRLEFLFQFLVFTTAPLAFGFRPAQVLAKPLVVATLLPTKSTS